MDIFPSLNTRIFVILQFDRHAPQPNGGLCRLSVRPVVSVWGWHQGEVSPHSTNCPCGNILSLGERNRSGDGAGCGHAQPRDVTDAAWRIAPRMVMRLGAGSVPVGFLVLEGKTTPIGMVADVPQNMVRPLVL
ncbi:MAG TPA: hypothetical protein VIK18_03260 [Pirellulales bacterium]